MHLPADASKSEKPKPVIDQNRIIDSFSPPQTLRLSGSISKELGELLN